MAGRGRAEKSDPGAEQRSRERTKNTRRGWRSIGLIQEFGGAGGGDVGRTRFTNETKRALSARMAGRNGDGWLSELRQIDKEFQSSSRTCLSACAGERPVFRRRHVSDA